MVGRDGGIDRDKAGDLLAPGGATGALVDRGVGRTGRAPAAEGIGGIVVRDGAGAVGAGVGRRGGPGCATGAAGNRADSKAFEAAGEGAGGVAPGRPAFPFRARTPAFSRPGSPRRRWRKPRRRILATRLAVDTAPAPALGGIPA